MKLTLKRVTPLSMAKISGLCYAAMGLLFIPFMLLGPIIAALAPTQGPNDAPAGLFIGMGVGFALFTPIIYGMMGFVIGLIGAFIYNLIAGWVGGIEVDFDANDSASVPTA
ncbi:MAG: hypothetical protein CBD18_06100 [Opitutales bacterium TMED158]|nr:MAG: hypothetical protein CBD18_06100 [Opitutales bacterium TMED158]